MFNVNTAQETDQIVINVKGREVKAVINTIRCHTINFNALVFQVTTDEPIAVWNKNDVRNSFSITQDVEGWKNQDKVTRIIA